MSSPQPLSFAQHGLWQEMQWSPGHPAFHVYTAFRIEGAFDPAMFEQCLGDVLRRHEILRAVIVARDAAPVQIVTGVMTWPLRLVALEGLTRAAAWRSIKAAAGDEVARPFDLEQGPLVRGTVFRLSSGDHVVLLVLHHLVCDGLSKGILLRELAAAYEARMQRRAWEPPPLSAQYLECARHQRSSFETPSGERLVSYWTQRLAEFPAYGRLAMSGTRVDDLFAKVSASFQTSTASQEALSNVVRRDRVTPFMVWLWLVAVWIREQTAGSDVIVACEMANRLRLEAEPLVGLFADWLLYRISFRENDTLRASLVRVRAMTLETYAHQGMPSAAVIDILRARLGRRHLRCDAFLNVRRQFRFQAAMPAATWRHIRLVREQVASPLPLNVSVKEASGRTELSVFHHPTAYSSEAIGMLRTRIEQLLTRLDSTPDDVLPSPLAQRATCP